MIFDVEADGLLDKATKIHVLAYEWEGGVRYTHDYDEMRKLLTEAKVLKGHNIVAYDVPLLEKILGINIKAKLIDTLALSWYLNHHRILHGLEWYGVDYGIPKPKIDDWENLTSEEYANRCVEDVKINQKVWKDLKEKLLFLYDDKKQADKLIQYLTFKMKCAALQEKSKWKTDELLINKSISTLSEEQDKATNKLIEVMPKVPVYKTVNKPSKPYKKDGTLSVAGAKWFNLLSDMDLPEDHSDPIEVLIEYKEPNPNSTPQIKEWLFSLGWEPAHFDFKKNSKGEERKIPQVRIEGDDGKELCKSVKVLIEKEPNIEVL